MMMNTFPTWVPEAARHYLVHTEAGLSIRQLAREAGCHASTVMRQVRKVENRRDDPLIDGALRALGDGAFGAEEDADARAARLIPAERLDREALRVLRRLCEPGALLAAAPGMDKAVVVRESEETTCRTAVVDLDLAQAMALKDWIACLGRGRVARYRITPAGRQALTRLVGQGERLRFEENQRIFEGAQDGRGRGRSRSVRVESPLLGLARRLDRNGAPFLSPDLVAAGERLREEYELAGLDAGGRADWAAIVRGEAPPLPEGEAAARSGPP
ncbi:helix-turn-helix domain-containing protein, partial [Aquicoccus sp. SCR17]|nr:helix-turn-helix domain-containing protein [Carideicomes alvinocaridis]